MHSYNDKQCLSPLAYIYQHARCSQPWSVIAEMQVAIPIDRNAAVFGMQMLVSCDGIERNIQQWQRLVQQ